jgi:hypothetical protein
MQWVAVVKVFVPIVSNYNLEDDIDLIIGTEILRDPDSKCPGCHSIKYSLILNQTLMHALKEIQ